MTNRILKVCALVLFMAGYTGTYAQVKIGDNPTTINPNSVLELESTNKGLLLPRVGLDSTTSFAPLAAHVAGMTVYNTDSSGTGATGVTPGYYYNDGTQWVRLASGGTAWQLLGNAGTLAASNLVGQTVDGNFLGTTDAQSLVLGTNNTKRMILDTMGNAVGGVDNYLSVSNAYDYTMGNFIWGANDTIDVSGGSANGYNNVVFGFMNKSTAANSSIFGYSNKDLNNILDEGYNFIAGSENRIWDTVGTGASGNTVMGFQNRLNAARYNIVLGMQNRITQHYNSFIVGLQNTANTDSAFAVGYNNTVNHNGSFAVGQGATTTAPKQFSANFDGGYRLLGIAPGAATDSIVTDSAGYIRHRSVASLTDSAWKITGNVGTIPPTAVGIAIGSNNYWGTRDAKNLAVGTNGISRMLFDTLGNAYGGKNNIIANGTTLDIDNNIYPASSFMWGVDNVDSSYTNAIFGIKNKIGGSQHSNIIAGEKDTITGTWGWGNAVFGVHNFVTAENGGGNVVGGIENRRVGTNLASGNGGALFGYQNVDSSYFSSVVGGSNNVLGQGAGNSLVTGGGNKISTPAFVGWNQGIAHSNAVFGDVNTITSTTSAKNANQNIVAGNNNKLVDNSYAAVFGTTNIDSANAGLVAGSGNIMGPNASSSIALGIKNMVSGPYSVALGGDDQALTGWDGGNTVSGEYSFAMGSGNKSIGRHSHTMGDINTATGYSSFAGGELSNVTNDYAFAWGGGNQVGGNSAAAFGYGNSADGAGSFVAGGFNHTNSVNSTVFGSSNVFTGGSPSTIVPTDPRFQVGNGPAYNNRKNAFTILNNGYTAIGTHTTLPLATLHVYGNAKIDTLPNAAVTDSILTDSLGYVRHISASRLAGDDWHLTGNARTTPPTSVGAAVGTANYWGTSDAKNLAVGTAGITRAIFNQNGSLFGGRDTYDPSLPIEYSLVWGFNNKDSSDFTFVTGHSNTLGTKAGWSMVGGSGNTVNGRNSLIVGNANKLTPAGFGDGNLIAGMLNEVSGPNAEFNTVGGLGNKLYNTSYALVQGNQSRDSSSHTVIAGAQQTIGINADYSVLLGSVNTIVGNGSTPSYNNTVMGSVNKLIANGETAANGQVLNASNVVSGYNSTVINSVGTIVGGQINYSRRNAYSIMVGDRDTLYNAESAAVFGRFNKDSASYSLVSGQGNTITSTGTNSVVSGLSNTSGQPNEVIGGSENRSYSNGLGYNAIFGGKNTMGSPTHPHVGANMIAGWNNKINAGVEEFIFGQQCSILTQPGGSGGTGDFVTGFGNVITNIGGSTAAGGYGMNGVFGSGNTVTSNNTNYGTFTNFVYGQNNTVRGYGNLVGGGSNGGNTITAGSENVVMFGRNSVINNAAADVLVAGTALISNNNSETVVGAYNLPIANTLFSVGNGTSAGNRSDALTVLNTGPVTGGATANSSTLNVNGSVSMNIVTVSTTYTVLPTDYTVLFADQTAAFTCTLPDPTTCKGRILVFCNYGTQATATNNTVTLATPAGNLKYRTGGTTNTVQSAASYPLASGIQASGAGGATGFGFAYTWKMTLQSNGTDWYIIGNEP